MERVETLERPKQHNRIGKRWEALMWKGCGLELASAGVQTIIFGIKPIKMAEKVCGAVRARWRYHHIPYAKWFCPTLRRLMRYSSVVWTSYSKVGKYFALWHSCPSEIQRDFEEAGPKLHYKCFWSNNGFRNIQCAHLTQKKTSARFEMHSDMNNWTRRWLAV